MSNEIPFPTPLSVIRSPNHIAKIVPDVNKIIDEIQKVGPSTRKASAGKSNWVIMAVI